MPKQELPEQVGRAIACHLQERHGVELDEGEVGMRAGKRSLQVVWREESEEERASFCCRRCPEGFDRYLVEVNAPVPSERILALIGAHFRQIHRIKLSPRAIYHAENQVAAPAAVFLPMLPERGAGIICKRCSPRGRTVIVSEPAYGDARRLRYLLRERKLWAEVATLPPREQAEYLEAIDRGLPQQRQQAEARRALKRSRRRERALPREALARALQQTLLAHVADGEQITPLVKRLERYSQTRPSQLARLLAPALGASAAALQGAPPRELTKIVAHELGFADGRLPRLKERWLWDLWKDVKEDAV